MHIGDIVISRAGHDKGKPFAVIAEVDGEFVLIADGRARGVQNPKLKRKKHLRTAASDRLDELTDDAVKAAIKQFISERRVYAEK